MDFYDTTFICTYKQADNDITDDLYRSQFLQAFKLDKWNDNKITNMTDKLFEVAEEHFLEIFTEMKGGNTKFSHMLLFMGEHLTNSNLFRVFFVYDLFDLFHRCICDLKIEDKIKEEHYAMFKNAVLLKNNQ